jgi:hypothetical protein
MTGNQRSSRPTPDWPAIRRAYEDQSLSVRKIAEGHGVTVSALNRRRTAEGWPRRAQKKPSPAGRSKRSTGQSIARGRKAIVERLYNILERNLKLMEVRMETSEPGTAADRERDTRAIGSLTRTVGKITELDAETKPVASTAAGSEKARGGIDEAEADRIRVELAQRILKFRERRQSR